MGAVIRSRQDYEATLLHIRQMQERLRQLAVEGGNLAPEVIALSQEIDDYIVSIQRYWEHMDAAGEAM